MYLEYYDSSIDISTISGLEDLVSSYTKQFEVVEIFGHNRRVDVHIPFLTKKSYILYKEIQGNRIHGIMINLIRDWGYL
jgi:hypothetical protein